MIRRPLFSFLLLATTLPARSFAGDAAKPHTIGKEGLTIEGKIDKTDPDLPGVGPSKMFLIRLEKGKSYVFEAKSRDFDTCLVIFDPKFKTIGVDEDSGDGTNSFLEIKALEDATHRVVVASSDKKRGSFILLARAGTTTPEELERKTLTKKMSELTAIGSKECDAGDHAAAEKAWQEALAIARRLYPEKDFPEGHAELAICISNMAFLRQAQGKAAEAEPLLRDVLAMQKRLIKGDHVDIATSLNNLASVLEAQGKLAEAEPLFKDALAMRERVHKGDHSDVASTMSNLALLLHAQGKRAAAEAKLRDALAMQRRLFREDHPYVATTLNNLAHVISKRSPLEAEPLYREALAMRRRLYKADHMDVAGSLNNLASLLEAEGKLAEAESLLRDSLAMHQRIFAGDHPAVAASLHNLGMILFSQEKFDEAEPICRDALTMHKNLYKGDHVAVATALNNYANVLHLQKKSADAEPHCRDALAMFQRLFKGDHPDVVLVVNNLANVLQDRGKLAQAERLYRDALDMQRRILPVDDPVTASMLNNLATVYQASGRLADAERLTRDALVMSRRLTIAYAKARSEGEALTLAAAQPRYRDGFLSVALLRKADPATVYQEIWADKGAITRIYERRQQAARAAASDPEAAKLLGELADLRGRRADLLLAPAVKDATTRRQRDEELEAIEKLLAGVELALRRRLPVVARADKLAAAGPADLQKTLPEGAVVVDYLRYIRFEYDLKEGESTEAQSGRYFVFVLSRDRLVAFDLGLARPIEEAIIAWRQAITRGKEVPKALPEKVRQLLWDAVRKELPEGTKTVYICPDEWLCRTPWAALPGDKPGTILLEDFALASIPHAPFLLDQLWPQDSAGAMPTEALVVGGVKYDAAVKPMADPLASRSGPLLKPGAKLGWSFLPGTLGEAGGFTARATREKLATIRLEGEAATRPAFLASLPRAKVAHLATHGFFSEPSFRSIFQLDERDYERTRRGQRIGRAANSPLVMTGLVMAGANHPKTGGRGIVTGEALIDLDLSGLELAVLSACETGLGDVAGGEGTFGLQRAFHMAGTRNVIASLWKVPDQPTAALMNLFYRNLWEKDLPPMEALRQAQLEIYRNPKAISELAREFRGKFEEVPGSGEVSLPPAAGGKAHPLLWAAFGLSGIGR